VQVLYGTADNAAFPSHARALHAAVTHDDKELIQLTGANHYFIGQPDQVRKCVSEMVRWAREHELA
jgi:alpha/beta superfamily hydrolase